MTDTPSFDPCPHHTPDAGGAVASELHGVCIFCWRDWWAQQRATVSQLEQRVDRMEKTLCFFASVIKSGEPWTPDCAEALQRALTPGPDTGGDHGE